MIKRAAFILFTLFTAHIAYTQQRDKIKIDLSNVSQKTKNVEQIQNRSEGFVLRESIASVEIFTEKTKEGYYGKIVSDGFSKTYDAGNPDLPVINRLIEIPTNKEVRIRVVSYDEEIVDLKNYNFHEKIIPAQPSHVKSEDPKKIPFVKNDQVYSKNEFYRNELVKFEDRGYLRNKHLGYLEISPFIYNPVTNVLKVLNNLKIEVSFIPASQGLKTSKSSLSSSYFNSINYPVVNQIQETENLVSGPVKYVIVADRMFEEALQEFVLWKTQKGFKVVEAYTDDIGTTTTEIKTFLQDLYENPTDGIAPTFALLVGDVAQIPTFSGNAGGHKTDLYYFEYTGDKLPEVFYGRFSAETIEELQPQIDKTLELEKYQMPDPTYLDNVVLVAGVDGSYAPTHGNGAINYANDYYTNSANGINSYYYLYGDDSGVMSSNNSGASVSIRNYISEGVSFSNYTAHCGISGWSNPSFNSGHVDGLTNNHMYPLIIGNCCQSNTFNYDDCFGEELLKAANKGAVGYIGGSNNTYWDEDYYWAIGLTNTITANPTYEGSGLGAYDRFFHSNGEAKTEWYVTQGQINVAGNLAVEASASSLKAYYWEIYHLMGDPSLTPYIKTPSALVASYDTEMEIGDTALEVSTEENAFVAISFNGELIDARLTDSTGIVHLSFNPLTEVGILDIVITKQNRQPVIDQIDVIPATTPYVTLKNFYVGDTLGNGDGQIDYGETIMFDIVLKNLSEDYDAFNVSAKLISSDTSLVITDSIQEFGSVPSIDSIIIEKSFSVDFNHKFRNNHEVKFVLEVQGEDLGGIRYNWKSEIVVNVNAPSLRIDEVIINDVSGNSNGLVEPGESGTIGFTVANEGNAFLKNLRGEIYVLGNSGNYLSLESSPSDTFTLAAQEIDTLEFNFTANAETPVGTSVYFTTELVDSDYSFYSVSKDQELTIGVLPELLITDNDTTILTKAYFYDSGGGAGVYSNNENNEITLLPVDSNKYLSVDFLEFSIEQNGNGCYDYLLIFNGMNTDAELIDSYCNSNIPSNIVASNPDGALTFKFLSDYSVTESGWKAEIRSIQGYQFDLMVTDGQDPVKGAIVKIAGRTDTTNTEGQVSFSNIPEGINYELLISATGFESKSKVLNIYKDTSENIVINKLKYDVTFVLSDEQGSVDGDIIFNNLTKTTTQGTVTFEDVFYQLDKEFVVQSYGCEQYVDTLDVTAKVDLEIILQSLNYNIEFNISDGVNPVPGATIEFDNKQQITDNNGVTLFEQVKLDSAMHYIARKTNYDNLVGTVKVNKDSTINLIMIEGKAYYNVNFHVVCGENPIYNAEVILESDTLYTNNSGDVTFLNIEEADNIPFKITKPHFNIVEGSVNVAGENVTKTENLEYTRYEVTFEVNDGNNPLENAIVQLDQQTDTTDIDGKATIDFMYSLNKRYVIAKDGYIDSEGMINVNDNKTVGISMLLKTYNVTFIIKDKSSNLLDGVLVEFNNLSDHTNSNGEVIFSEVYPQDQITFSLTKEGFWKYDSTLSVVDQDVVFNAIMSSTTGVEDLLKESLKIYPNPSSGIFNIEIHQEGANTYQILVFDVIGSTVYQQEIIGESFIKEQINISHKPKGIYFISVKSDDGAVVSKRLIVR